jgi:hypothetical protein
MKTSASKAVRSKIEKGGTDRIWTYADFEPLPTAAVAATLTRMVKKGPLRRLRNGVYYMPRETRFGLTVPEPARIAAAVLDRKGVSWRPSGVAAYNALGLTTQLSPVATFDVDREVTSLRTNPGAKVRLRSVASIKNTTPEERAVLDALRDLRLIPDTAPEVTVNRIAEFFRSGRVSFERIVKVALKEPPRVRALLGVIGTMLGKGKDELSPLKMSLNATTTYKLGLAERLPAAREWRIR